MKLINNIYFDMVKYFNNDVKRINHASKVYCFAHMISEKENVTQEKQLIIEAAAILHDIGIKQCEMKYNSTAGHFQEIEGVEVAKRILMGYNIDNYIKDRILYIIGNHHSYNKIDDIDFQIIVESDFIVNIYEDGIEPNQIKTLKEKYFMTSSGIALLTMLYNM